MDYDIYTAKARINRNGGRIKGKQIFHRQPGLKLLGAIDYLVNYHKFSFFKVEPKKGRKTK